MPNKVKYGLRNVHYAKITEGPDGAITYETPKRIPGAVSLTLDPEGEISPFYADVMVYYQSVSNQGYTGTLEIATTPEEFATDILGETKTDGVLYESTDDKGSAFALMFELQGDVKATRHLYYNCTASRSGVSAETTGENSEPQTDELSFTASTHPENRLTRARTTVEVSPEIYNSWFTAVHQKAEPPLLP